MSSVRATYKSLEGRMRPAGRRLSIADLDEQNMIVNIIFFKSPKNNINANRYSAIYFICYARKYSKI